MTKIASYILSEYQIISTQSTDELLNLGNFMQNRTPIPSNVLDLEGDFIIVGDIHGSLHDLLRILKFIKEKNTKVLFLGDYVDRGNFSLECITILFALKIINPDRIYLLRGNHEFDSICSQYGFKNEILNFCNPQKPEDLSNYSEKLLDQSNEKIEQFIASHKNKCCYEYTESLYNSFLNVFSYLPISAIINKTTFCVHGGLSPKLDLVDKINTSIKRPIQTFDECPLLSELVWSDPSAYTDGLFDENPRGNGYLFNKEAVYKFLKRNSLHRIIRAHQCVHKGCLQNFKNICITVFSVSSYAKFLGNSSAVLELFQSDDRIESTVFLPIRHLMKNEAIYYKVQEYNQKDVKINNYFSLSHPTLKLSNVAIRNAGLRNKNINISKNCSNLSAVVLVKPKFVTNSRKSYSYANKRALHNFVSSNNFNENSVIIDENNLNYNIFNSTS